MKQNTYGLGEEKIQLGKNGDFFFFFLLSKMKLFSQSLVVPQQMLLAFHQFVMSEKEKKRKLTSLIN